MERRSVKCGISGDTYTTRARLHYSTCPGDNYATAEEMRDGQTSLGSGPRTAFIRDPDRNRGEDGRVMFVPVTVLKS